MNVALQFGCALGVILLSQWIDNALAQGLVLFNNRVAGVVDARVTFPTGPNAGQGLGAGYAAQLFGGPEGTFPANLTALAPTTTFRTSSVAAQGYVNPVVVEVPGVASGNKAKLQMRVLDSNGVVVAFSSAFTVTLGGDILPPANLQGLQPFAIFIPEPGTLPLFVVSGVVFLASIWKLRRYRAVAPRRTVGIVNEDGPQIV